MFRHPNVPEVRSAHNLKVSGDGDYYDDDDDYYDDGDSDDDV